MVYINLCDSDKAIITTALSGEVITSSTDSGCNVREYVEIDEGSIALFKIRFIYGSDTQETPSCKIYVQTSIDGVIWADIICVAATDSSLARFINLNGSTPKTTLYTPTDGTLTDNTAVDGILGRYYRVKVTSTPYSDSTQVEVKCLIR